MTAGTRFGSELRRWYRHAQRLFHVLVGLTFLALAVAGAWVSFGEWRDYLRTPSAGVWRFGILAGFTVMLVILGLYSFLKARSVR
jgi:hypothetical protein